MSLIELGIQPVYKHVSQGDLFSFAPTFAGSQPAVPRDLNPKIAASADPTDVVQAIAHGGVSSGDYAIQTAELRVNDGVYGAGNLLQTGSQYAIVGGLMATNALLGSDREQEAPNHASIEENGQNIGSASNAYAVSPPSSLDRQAKGWAESFAMTMSKLYAEMHAQNGHEERAAEDIMERVFYNGADVYGSSDRGEYITGNLTPTPLEYARQPDRSESIQI